MAWSAPMTAVANDIFTAAQFNTFVKNNLLETAPAKAANASGYFVTTGTNAISERVAATANVATAQNTTTTLAFHDLATVGPSVTVDTGTKALVLFKAHVQHNTGPNTVNAISVDISGATTSASTFNRSAQIDGLAAGEKVSICGFQYVTLNAGSNTFKLQYYTTTATAAFELRELVVFPF